MKKHYRLTLAAGIALFAVLAGGCGFISNLLGTGDGNPPDPSNDTVTITTLVQEVSESLGKAGYPLAVRNIVSAGAESVAATEADLLLVPDTDLDALIPSAVGGSIASIESITGYNDEQRLALAEAVLAAWVSTLNGRFEATSRSVSAARTMTSGGEAIKALLGRISRAAISNLAKTGIISLENRADAAGTLVGTLVSSLSGGGVNKTVVNDAVGMITKAAVSSLVGIGLDQAQALATAVTEVTRGAVSAISATGIEGISGADYGTMAAAITKGASEALDDLATDAGTVMSLAAAVSQGASVGVAEVLGNDTGAVAADLIRGIVAGTADATLSSTYLSATEDAAAIIGAITGSTSETLSARITELGLSIQVADVLTEVVKAASASAQVLVAGGMNQQALQEAIILKDGSETITTTVATSGYTVAIDEGIAAGQNSTPLAVLQPERAATVLSALILDGSDSSDADADELSYSWAFIARPSLSVTVLPQTGSTTTLTPDVAGTYIVSLKVSDGLAWSAEVYCTVTAAPPATNPNWEGKTAAQRLVMAQGFLMDADYMSAKNEALVVLARYPESPAFAEAGYIAGKALRGLGDISLAQGYLDTAIQEYPSLEYGLRAKLLKADMLLWDQAVPDVASAGTLYQAIDVDDTTFPEDLLWEAKLGRVAILFFQGDAPQALTVLTDYDNITSPRWVALQPSEERP